MTFEEITRLAEQGNAQAMLELGNHYFDQKDYDGFEKAYEWYEKAAITGSSQGILMAINQCALLGAIHQSKGFQLWEEALQNWLSVQKWIRVAWKDLSLDSDTLSKIQCQFEESNYSIAYIYCRLKRYSDALNILCSSNETPSLLLKGICTYSLAIAEGNKGYLMEAYKMLSVIEEDLDYVANEKPEEEEYVFSIAVYFLSSFYHNGLSNNVSVDLDRAVKVLTTACNVIHDADYRNVVQKELSRYKKKLLGGYKYL